MALFDWAAPLDWKAYTRDTLGRIVTRVETIQGSTTTWEYGYHAAGRLESVTKDGLVASQYAYDANGNRLVKQTPAVHEIGTYDAQDRMLTYAGASYTYTANGETLTKTDATGTTSYQYDVFGNLLGVDLPTGTQIRYKVDGRNRRVERSVNGIVTQRWLWQGQLSPIAELNASNAVVSRFVYATRVNVPDYMIRGGATYRILHDHLGSPRLVVNTSTGAVAQRMDFDEWGIVTTDTNPGWQPFGFGGSLIDSIAALARFGFRDFRTDSGRWNTKDLIGFSGGDTNLYAFVENRPSHFSDVSGLAHFCNRPLQGTEWSPSLSYDPSLNDMNLAWSHEQLFFDDGSNENVGFFGDGTVRPDDPANVKDYRVCENKQYDDELMRLAVERARDEAGKYGFVRNNCQDWADKVRFEYRQLEIEQDALLALRM
jgi:RHS repeat-associated protein